MNIEEKYGLKNKEAILLCFVMLLTIAGFAISVIKIFNGIDVTREFFTLLLYIFIIYYSCYYYTKPHGNLFKWMMLFYGAVLFVNFADVMVKAEVTSPIVYVICGGVISLVGYFAGRLGKGNENKPLGIIILILIIAIEAFVLHNYSIYLVTLNASGSAYFLSIVSVLSAVIQWIDLISAYFVRFRLHKDSGIEADEDY